MTDTNDSFDPNGPASANGGIFGLDCSPQSSAVVLLPVPFDATTSYRPGTAQGPQAILNASAQLDLFDLETGRPYEAGIAMLPISEQVCEWNRKARILSEKCRLAPQDTELRQQLNDYCATVNQWVESQVADLLKQGKIVGAIGGDHATPYGAIRAHLEHYPTMGMLHIDAHADLRKAYEGFEWSHASIMYNVITKTELPKLIQIGVRDFCESEMEMIRSESSRISTYFDQTLAQEKFSGKTFAAQVDEMMKELPNDVYVSLDIDGLDPKLCPNTGTPVPGGLSFQETCALLSSIGDSGRRLVGFDLCEVAPGPDGDEWDGNVGMRLLYKLCGHSIRTRSVDQ